MTPQEALDAIAQLCRDSWSEGGYEGGDAVISADDVRAILGRVEPGPAVPVHDVDRDALLRVLAENGFDNSGENPHSWRCKWYAETAKEGEDPYCDCPQQVADAILALVRPVEGSVVLTPEERGKLAYLVEHATYSGTIDVFVSEWFEEHAEDLKVRLEGARTDAEPSPAVPARDIDREGAWQYWKAREGCYWDSPMTDLRQAFEAGWDAAAAVRPSAPVSDTRTGGAA